MRTFKNVAAQGDVYFRRIDTLPANVELVPLEDGTNIVTHSETGHHHVMDGETVEMYKLPDSILDCLLVVKEPTPLVHLREHHTHEPIMFDKGVYHVRRQREYIPEGYRKAQD